MTDGLLRALWSLLLLLALQQLGSAGLIHAKALLAPILIERAFEQSRQRGGGAVKPWPWADTWPLARMRFPNLGVSRLVLEGDEGAVLAFSPGHSRASAAPGEGGQVVIVGHRDTHFAFLQRLRRGEKLELELADGRRRLYRVADMAVVDASREKLYPDRAGERLLLVTCYPFDSLDAGGSLRYVVRAEPVSTAAAAFAF